tara:strand:- start:462 stop:671 length:210 start_codon:yes stop_codon:yes gene_type:complete
MARDPMINTVTGQKRVIRKKGDLTTGKGDWIRGDLCDEQYKKNYDKIFGKRNMLVENKIIADEKSDKEN